MYGGGSNSVCLQQYPPRVPISHSTTPYAHTSEALVSSLLTMIQWPTISKAASPCWSSQDPQLPPSETYQSQRSSTSSLHPPEYGDRPGHGEQCLNLRGIPVNWDSVQYLMFLLGDVASQSRMCYPFHAPSISCVGNTLLLGFAKIYSYGWELQFQQSSSDFLGFTYLRNENPSNYDTTVATNGVFRSQ